MLHTLAQEEGWSGWLRPPQKLWETLLTWYSLPPKILSWGMDHPKENHLLTRVPYGMTYMQFLAARSLWTILLLARYSIPLPTWRVMSINFFWILSYWLHKDNGLMGLQGINTWGWKYFLTTFSACECTTKWSRWSLRYARRLPFAIKGMIMYGAGPPSRHTPDNFRTFGCSNACILAHSFKRPSTNSFWTNPIQIKVINSYLWRFTAVMKLDVHTW